MKTHIGDERFRNFRILLDSGISSTIMMNNLTSKDKCKYSTTTTWQTQARKFTTNNMAKVDFRLSEFSENKL